VNVWKQVADILLKVVETGELDAAFIPIFGGIAPLFLLKITGNLSLELVDQDLLL
jgi:hypothetical protein